MGQKCGCGKNQESDDELDDMDTSNHLKIHVQTKKEFQEALRSGKLSQNQKISEADFIGDSTSSYEDIRKVYIFDKKELGHGHFGSVRRAK